MASVARIQRIIRLVELLQSGRHHNSAELADQLGVSRRTIFRDLNTLQESGLMVRYDESRQAYSLPLTMFLPPTDFTLPETLAMLVLCHELGDETSGIPALQAARSAGLKLAGNLPANLRDYVSHVTESIAVRLDAHNPLQHATGHYESLLKSLAQKRCVRIRYHSLTEWTEITTKLSPYRLLFLRRSWYAIGRSSLHRSVRTFNLGRILKAEILEDRYDIPPRFTVDRYLGNAWRLIREKGRRYDVVVRFQKMVATNVAEVRWHKTQRIVRNDDGTIDFHVTVDGLGEIVWWVLGYGHQAEVIEPPELREIVRQHAARLNEIYSPSKSTGETKQERANGKKRTRKNTKRKSTRRSRK